MARKYSVTHKTILNNLNRICLKYRKQKKTPKYDEKQALKSKRLSRKLVNLLYSENSEIIIDDEKYFCFSNDEIPGNSGFYTNDINKCPDKLRFK